MPPPAPPPVAVLLLIVVSVTVSTPRLSMPPPPLSPDVLPEVVDAVRGRIPVLMDGGIRRGLTGGIVPSYQDFGVWYANEFIERGIGLYFDNSFPEKAFDPVTTSAYRLPNGRIQPSAGMWHRRDYLRRIWTLHEQHDDPQAPVTMMMHMTNTHIAAYMGWNHVNLDLEYRRLAVPQQRRWHHALLRAHAIGRQTGNIPTVLAAVEADSGTPEEVAFARRSRFGVMTVHEIKCKMSNGYFWEPYRHLVEFGYGEDDCRVWNYWDDGYPLHASDDDVKTLLMERNGAVLVVLATWNGDPEMVHLTLDSAELGVELAEAFNAETDEALPFDGQTVELDLEGYGVRVLRFE